MKLLLSLLLLTFTLLANIPQGGLSSDPLGHETRYTYDAAGRLTTVTDDQGTTTYDYDAAGRVTKITYPSGITTEYGYDLRDRITRIVHKASDGTILRSFAYSYDAVGNPVKVVEDTGRTVTYEYNSVNQLIKETVSNDPDGNNTVTTFAYDQAGNLVSKTVEGITTEYSYDADGKLIQKGSITYTYDANGNLIDDGTNAYEYDEKNRLVKITTPTQTIEYTYDAQDHRIAKIVEGTTTTYLVDPNTPYARVIHESRDNGTEIDYSYGLRLLNNGEHTFLTDALGSTRALADGSGQITDSYDYTPYGELLRHTGSSDTPFLFTGEQYDPEAGLYYLRARYYSPELSRFLTRDTYEGTLADPLSQNPYLYARGNPVLYVDPSGRCFSVGGLSNSMAVMGILAGVYCPHMSRQLFSS